MLVRAKLYGTLGKSVPGYVHSGGTIVEIPDNGKVNDLLSALKLLESEDVVVAMDGLVLTRDDQLLENAYVNVMQRLHGG